MPAGLRLPPGVLQPFFLRLDPDDLHVMAVIDGHPAYEAVEAMIRWRVSGEPSVRAILTRHDQSQIDHINDAERLAGMAGAVRETHARDISLVVEDAPSGRRCEVAFQSGSGEAVAFSISTLFPPSPAGAGLTDPGGHSPTTSLPLMWRRASALAGAQSWVSIAGARFALPLREVPPGARAGYFTEGHTLGAVRAGASRLRARQAPAAFQPGESWVFAGEDGDAVYDIVEAASDVELLIARRDGAGERIRARADGGGGLIASEIRLGAGGPERDLALVFGDGEFRIDLEGQEGLVRGRFSVADDAQGWTARLAPAEPAWTCSRAVTATCRRDGDDIVCETRVGG
jgi:hypothetical protein